MAIIKSNKALLQIVKKGRSITGNLVTNVLKIQEYRLKSNRKEPAKSRVRVY